MHKQLHLTAQTGSGSQEAEKSLGQKTQRETKELLVLCEAAAGRWEGVFDSVSEIQQLRRERDEAVVRQLSEPFLGTGDL